MISGEVNWISKITSLQIAVKAITFIVIKVSMVTPLRTFPSVCVIEVSTTYGSIYKEM